MTTKQLMCIGLCSALHLSLSAQWQTVNTGLPNNLSHYTMSTPSKDVVWTTLIDWNEDYNIDATNGNFLIRTTNGGASWQRSAVYPTSPAELATNVYALDALNAFVGTVDFNSGAAYLYRTSDGGASWTVLDEANNGISFEPFGFIDDIRFFDAQNGIILGDPDATGRFVIYTTRDGGNHWIRNNATPQVLAPNEIGIIGGAAFIAPNTYFFTTNPQNRLFKSDDRGLTFREIVTPYRLDTTRQAGLEGINFWDDRNGIAFTNYNPLFPGGALGTEPNVIRTTDGGETWQIISGNSAAVDSKGIGSHVPGADSTFAIGHFNRGVTTTTNFGQNFVVDTQWTVTVDGKDTYAANAPNLSSIGGIEFKTASSNTEYLVDDITLRPIVENEIIADAQKRAKQIAYGVYPNPTSDDLTIAYELKSVGDLTLTLTDVSGRIVFQKHTPSLKTGTETVQMKDLAKGTYLLRLTSADDKRTEKIVKY